MKLEPAKRYAHYNKASDYTVVSATFSAYYDFPKDDFVPNEKYQAQGGAVIYLTDKFYAWVEKQVQSNFGKDVEVNYNNTGTMFWF